MEDLYFHLLQNDYNKDFIIYAFDAKNNEILDCQRISWTAAKRQDAFINSVVSQFKDQIYGIL